MIFQFIASYVAHANAGTFRTKVFFCIVVLKFVFFFLLVLEGKEERQVQHDLRKEDKDESKEVKER